MPRNFSAPHEADDRAACTQDATPERRETAAIPCGPRGESWMKGEGLVPLPQSTGGNSIFIVVASEIRRSRMGLTDPRRVSRRQRHSRLKGNAFRRPRGAFGTSGSPASTAHPTGC